MTPVAAIRIFTAIQCLARVTFLNFFRESRLARLSPVSSLASFRMISRRMNPAPIDSRPTGTAC
ncbi:hypothetical protein DESC_310108 [Desulfosarcina cetonica]|nr:hypothetical protein DESC_310108 [Desulfosarcina cetonica]